MTEHKPLILLVEDEKSIRNFIETSLTANGYKVMICGKGKEAISLVSSHCPDLVLLDLGLPDMDGMEILKEIRQWTQLPVIVVSARIQEEDKVQALDYGADDYITKPFGIGELMARIRTALRHQRRGGRVEASLEFKTKELSIDFDKREVLLSGEKVHLTQIEYKLVSLLAKNQGRVLTYESMMTDIWGPHMDKNNQILRVNMANIRRKLEKNPADPEYIFTEVGVGYRMIEEA